MSKLSKFIGFYSEKDPITGYLSNWYKCDFTVDGKEFSSSEQYLMYMKAVTFNDNAQKEAIMATDDLATIKACGRKVQNFDNKIWNGIRQFVMLDGLMAKFSQNEELKEKLLATYDAVLAECSPNDLIWGIGLDSTNADSFDTDKWRGQNLLGFTLMTVRDRLKTTEEEIQCLN